MLKIVCIYDYGTGNHSSVENAIKKLGSKVLISNNIDVLKKSDGIIFPGVGSFPMAMNNLNKKKIKNQIIKLIKNKKPILGICLGMQILTESSEELLFTKGLSVFPGMIKYNILKKPNIGWKKIEFISTKSKYYCLNDQYFYFQHSLSYKGPTKYQKAVVKKPFMVTAIIENDNVTGVQFHPEKSQLSGEKFLSIFLGIN
jgi:glutamine amidotransferase